MFDISILTIYRARFRHAVACGNVADLEQLKDVLRGESSKAAAGLLREVAATLSAVRAARAAVIESGGRDAAGAQADPACAGSAPPDRPAQRHLEPVLAEILVQAGLPAPDGRTLYRYPIDDASFAALKDRLGVLHRGGCLRQPSPGSAALFAVYVAVWFQREYNGGQYRWESPLPSVIGTLPAQTIKVLAREGLAWWGLAPRRTAGGEMRLLSLVLEGGFPTRLLETRERSRIAVHLRALIASLEPRADGDETTVAALSRDRGATLGAFDHEEFHILCAELALALVALKREANAASPPGVSASAWLDATRPTWRDQLPIHIANNSARRLLDDLVSRNAELLGGDAGCQRLLLHDGEGWVPGLSLEMEGEIRLTMAQAAPGEGRLHVFASGSMASVYAGELGVLEPPVDAGQNWLSRRRGGARPPAAFPFDSAVQVQLRSAEGRSLTLTWPRGSPLRSEMLVFADPRGDDAGSLPKVLSHLGGGSLSTRRRRVWLLTPPHFLVCPIDSETPAASVWRGLTHHLYEITHSAHAGPRDRSAYRIEVGAESDQAHQLTFDGPLLTGAETAGGSVTIFAGVPALRLRSGLRSQVPQTGQVQWRREGTVIWCDWATSAPQVDDGLVEVVWRDPKSETPLDRQLIALLPAGACITARPRSERGVAYGLENLDGWQLEAASDKVTSAASNAGLDVTFVGRPMRHVQLSLASVKARLLVRAPAPVAGGGFCGADGALLEDGARAMLEDLRGAVAFSSGRERLYLHGPHGSDTHIDFDSELPLWAASEEILRLLSASSGLDDVVRLELGLFGRGLKVGRYASTLTITPDGHVSLNPAPPPCPGPRRLCWLSMATARHRVLSEGSWTDRLPEDLHGPGIILPRQGERVVGRPTLVPGRPLPNEGLGRLQRATLIARGSRRRDVVGGILDDLAGDSFDAAADRGFLLSLTTTLDGIPPAAIDALAMLPEHPAALAGLAVAAETEEARGKVWLLERELPFLWAAVPLELWRSAFDSRRRTLERLLAANGFDDKVAASLAGSAVTSAADGLARLDPMLQSALIMAGEATAAAGTVPSLKDAAQDRCRRTADDFAGLGMLPAPASNNMHAASSFRRPGSRLADRLPAFMFSDSFRESLDAPCAVALAAAARSDDPCRIVLDAEQMRRAREARAREPLSFADMYTAALLLLARGAPLTV